jgi:hypothetical protein
MRNDERGTRNKVEEAWKKEEGGWRKVGGRREKGEGTMVIDGRVNLKITESTV